MRMLYLYIGGTLGHSSVQNKLVAKIDRFNKKGIATRGLFLSYEVGVKESLNRFIDMLPLPRVSNKYFVAVHQRRSNSEAVSYVIEQVQESYDVIYFRYPGASAGLLPILSKYGHKILFEHNSKELEELRLHGRSIRFGLRPSTLISWLQNKKWRIAHEEKYGPEMLRRVRMGLAVTHDMAEYEEHRAGGAYTCHGNSNGVDVSKVRLRSAPAFDGTELRMVFMRGASTKAPYHGVDRVINGLKEYDGPIDIRLYLVGSVFDKEKERVRKLGIDKMVSFTGRLSGKELDDIFDKCHVSFGSLGLHRIKMIEGSVLKVNESLARGIPIVVSHKDMELHYHEEFTPYFLKVPADDSAIVLEEVIRLAEDVHGNADHPKEMRALAKEFVDYDVKIERAVELIKTEFSK